MFCHDTLHAASARGIAFDVGANIGGMTVSMMLNGCQEVHLFEPAPDLHFLILENLKKNSLQDRTVFLNQKAVSDTPGWLHNCTFVNSWVLCPSGTDYPYPESPGAKELQPTTFSPQVITLDQYLDDLALQGKKLERKVTALKIDVDGYDFRVVKGAKNLIEFHKPVIMIELSMYVATIGDSIPDFISYLFDLPYLWYTDDGAPLQEDLLARVYPYNSSYDIVGIPL